MKASRLLSRYTRQLGFVSAPRVDRAVLRHVSLVRIASDRLMVVLVADTGVVRRLIENRIESFGDNPSGLGKFTRTMFARDLRLDVLAGAN